MLGIKVLAGAAILARTAFGEGVHLFNCWPWIADGATVSWISIVAYCENDADCSNVGYVIPGDNVCRMSYSTTEDDWHIWEGGPQSCTFPSGVTFSWNIPGNGGSEPAYSPVGTGSNGFRTFSGFRDNESSAAGLGGYDCKKIYYYV